MIWDRLDKDLVFTGIDGTESNDILKYLGGALVKSGYCKESFVDALAKRESQNPTGIDMSGFGIAIPHTDISHVIKDGIAIGTLNNPVRFVAMGTDDEFVDVKVVFALAITDPIAHLAQIQTLISILQDPNVLESIWLSNSPEAIIGTIKHKESLL
ncbi:MAG: PTS sugar transporter subunit IIA [Deltaproteobacteria bacterium]|jgi:PTS system galactitol-specific IIA component|nr:PTS sugar transporter subunit IIA [Deltaproteobacteria bacterium]